MTLSKDHILVAENGDVTYHKAADCKSLTPKRSMGTGSPLTLRNSALTWTDSYGGTHTSPEDSVPEDRS